MIVHAILLAAGSGSRFGGVKLLAPFGSGTVLSSALALVGAGLDDVTVVTGFSADAVEAEIRRAAPAARIVRASDAAEGMGASLRRGVAALPPSAEAAIVFLGDMPRIPPLTSADMIQAARADQILAAAPVWDGVRGHPVLFKQALFGDLLKLKGDAGARRLLDTLGERLARVPARDDGVLFDIDRPGDLA